MRESGIELVKYLWHRVVPQNVSRVWGLENIVQIWMRRLPWGSNSNTLRALWKYDLWRTQYYGAELNA